MFRFNRIIIAIAVLGLFASISLAEEGGSGHYMPGSMASFVDGVPAEPTFIARLNYLHYRGDTSVDRSIPIAGMTALNVEDESDAYGLTLLWAPDWDMGPKWQYAVSATIPWVTMAVEADVSTAPAGSGVTVRRKDRESGLGDIILMPVMFNYKVNPNLNTNFRLAVFAPTGDYDVGRLANPGKNFWTIEPTAAVMYFGQKNGIEASLFLGVDINTENPETDYKSGIQAHIDGTLAQHFPLWGGLAGAGANAFWYQQINDDSGDGANLGGFKARAQGIGPVLSYVTTIAGQDLIAEFKWLHEFDNQKRLEGDTLFFKVLTKF